MHTFTELTDATETGRKSSVRALQAWQFLISKAANRQIIRYEHLRRMMGYADDRPLTPILDHVMRLCESWDLPPLTAIAVNVGGVPGAGLNVPADQLDARREEVFAYDWFGTFPPTPDEFAQARANT